ncbi:MAG TPA: hypothetical protein VNI84_18425, partial [Pyrinomonadaceae bacterium]|nr:hypothetical protein [Pyrinomonadaceae bacterium]
MKILKQSTVLTIVFAIAFLGVGFGLATGANAQTRRINRINNRQIGVLLRRVETKSDRFRFSLKAALDLSRYNETRREENVNDFVGDFETYVDQLKYKFDARTATAADVEAVLIRAARIDDFMKRNLRRDAVVQRDWRNLRFDLNQLANYYSLAFNLDRRANMPGFPPAVGVITNADGRFTGTYRLNVYQSGSARTIAENATRYIRTNNRRAIYNRLVNRL